ncbi:hypothetical protein E2542_SST21595 [Spatholobus suberectus]|nr:hypothetical protein E2542_SST21595 [Spatholobus suberectus]
MDIVNAIITNFGRDRDVTILVHHASGTISEVDHYNLLSPSDDLSLRGNLHMLFLSGFYTNCLSPSPPKKSLIPSSPFNVQGEGSPNSLVALLDASLLLRNLCRTIMYL